MSAASRVRRRFAIGFRDWPKQDRPNYRRRNLTSLQDAIRAEKVKAQRMAAAKGKKK